VAAGTVNLGIPGAVYAHAEPIGTGSTNRDFYPGALPARSDVVMSTRTYRPDALDQLKAFQATRNEWLYSSDAAYVAQMKGIVRHVGLSANITTPRTGTPTPNTLRADPFTRSATGVSRDVDGKVTIPPYMAKNATAWNSIFYPEIRDIIMGAVTNAVAIGADSLEFDDPAMEYSVTQWAGGDFSPAALSAFQSYCQSSAGARGVRDLAAVDYDMAEWVKRRAGTMAHMDWAAFKKAHGTEPAWLVWTTFMRATTQNFLGTIRQYLHSQPRPLPLSLNVNNPAPIKDLTYLLDSTDYLISEIYHLELPRQMAAYHACAAAWQLPLVPSIVPATTADTQWGIALGYAYGDTPLVPWNTFVPDQPRYLGSVADYGYLFAFVRAHARYFDEYDEISDVALVVDENSATKDTVLNAAQACLDIGASFRLVVVRPNGVIGNHPYAFGPQLAVGVNVPEPTVRSLFPDVPVRALSNLYGNPNDPAMSRIIRTITPDPKGIVAVPRINKREGTLLIHVVDTTKSGQAFGSNDYLEIMVPQPYRSYFAGIQHAVLLRPNGDPLKRTVSVTQDSQNMKVRVLIAGMTGWGVLVFDRDAA
jgi:hypothetical protein